MSDPEIFYRRLEEKDIPAGLELCRSAGWNQTAKDWGLFIRLDADGGRVAWTQDRKVVGTVATLRYQDHFSWISMVLVDPGFQKMGIGLQLVKEGLKILINESTIKLDATPAGREVYLKLGFIDEHMLTRMEWPAPSVEKVPPSSAMVMSHDDLPAVLDWDRKVFGADRPEILKHLLNAWPRLAKLTKNARGEINGYCFGREGHRFTQIGPVVSQETENAIRLVSAALADAKTGPVVIDVLNENASWLRWLSSIGFEEQRKLTRMVRGLNNFTGIQTEQYAITGPEFG